MISCNNQSRNPVYESVNSEILDDLIEDDEFNYKSDLYSNL